MIPPLFRRTLGVFLFSFFLFSSSSAFALPAPSLDEKWKRLKSSALVPFSSEAEFEEYVQTLAQLLKEERSRRESKMNGGVAKFSEAPASPMASADSVATGVAKEKGESESITNVQEQGVDEGDIVKVWGDYLVILRRGKLFTVKFKEADRPLLQPISSLNVYPHGYTGGGWYDEMLIHDNRVIVMGYSYKMRATEIGLFSLSPSGKINHDGTYFLDSNDYYSSRNYASRLIGNKLIFYMPYYLFSSRYYDAFPKTQLPEIKKWLRGDEISKGKTLLAKTDIYKPIQGSKYPTLHVVVTCDLARTELDCSAKGILGPYSRNFYVSPDSVYVWVSPEYYFTQKELPEKERESSSVVYRMPLMDKTVSALRTFGTPVDQFSFKEADGFLNVLVRAGGAGDAMWHPEFTQGEVALLRVPTRRFSLRPEAVAMSEYTKLPKPEGYSFQNRFIGSYLLYGTGAGWYQPKEVSKQVYIKNISSAEPTHALVLPHGVDRIEALGEAAVVVGGNKQDLFFSSIALGAKPELRNTYKIEQASQGELRSHGFFFKKSPGGGGLLGLPVRHQGRPSQHLFTESAEVSFLRVSPDLVFSKLGGLEAHPSKDQRDNCVYSCVDWYGNSRPIFLGNRIFALMGYELVEGSLERGTTLRETKRVNFVL